MEEISSKACCGEERRKGDDTYRLDQVWVCGLFSRVEGGGRAGALRACSWSEGGESAGSRDDVRGGANSDERLAGWNDELMPLRKRNDL